MRVERKLLGQYAGKMRIRRRFKKYVKRLITAGYHWNQGGNEHRVFVPRISSRVIKITKTRNSYGAKSRLVDYLENLVLSNLILGDDIRLEYILYGDDKLPYIVISQPYIAGDKADEADIDAFWQNLDFLPHGTNSYRHRCGTIIADARPDNIFRSQDGDLFPFDVQILHGKSYLHYMLLTLLTEHAYRE